MAENLKTFSIAKSSTQYQERLNELDQAIASVKKNITYLDTLNIIDAVTDKKNFAAQMNVLTPNSSLVINTEPFNEGGINYSRGDIILKDASDIIHHIPGQSGGLYYPKRITQPNLEEMNYNIEYEFINAIPTEESTSAEVGNEVSNAAHLITFSGLGGGEASDSSIYGNWSRLNEFSAVSSIEPMIEFYLTNAPASDPSAQITSMERIELEYSIVNNKISVKASENADTLNYIWVKVK